MTDDLRSRLDRLGERVPDRSDAFERLIQVRERKQRNRRRGGLAIGLAVVLVGSLVAVNTLRETGTPVPRSSDTPNVPVAWQPPDVLTIWPEDSMQDATKGTLSAQDVQAAVDDGDPDLQWRLDPEQVAERFGLDFLGWSSADAHDLEQGDSRVTATLTPCPQAEACRPIGELQVVLVQPGRSDAGGVWSVSSVVSEDLTIDIAPMDESAALAERSAIDVELTLPENTVANVGLAAANPCAQTASLAPQLAAGTTALFVPDMEQIDFSCGEIGVGYAFAYATDDSTRPATDPFVDAAKIVYPWLTIVPIYVQMTSSEGTATVSPTSGTAAHPA